MNNCLLTMINDEVTEAIVAFVTEYELDEYGNNRLPKGYHESLPMRPRPSSVFGH